MNWYYAAAGKQAGPVGDEQFAELVQNGVITSETLVWREGMANWEPYRNLHRLPPPPAPPPPPATPSGWPTAPIPFGSAAAGPASGYQTEEQIFAREYKIDIGDALERAWASYTSNAGLIIGTCIVCGVIFFVGALISEFIASRFPLILRNITGSILSLLYSTPLVAGLQWFYLRLIRKEDAGLGDLFGGFRRNYAHLFLYGVVQILIAVIAAIPLIIVVIATGLAAAFKNGGSSPPDLAIGLILGVGAAGLVTLCVVTFVSTLFIYTILLIVDKEYAVWPAMRLSAKMVCRRYWMTLLFLIVVGLISASGVLVCCVGLLVTVPLSWSMLALLYDDNFRELQPHE